MPQIQAPILILNASMQPFLSVGRHFGMVKHNGHNYMYIKEHDAFIRNDWMGRYKKSVSFDDFVNMVNNESSAKIP